MFEDFKLRGKVVLDGQPFTDGLNNLKGQSKEFTDGLVTQMAGAMTVTNLAMKGMSLLSNEVKQAVQEFMKFDFNLKKVKTLLDQTKISMEDIGKGLQEIATQSGYAASELAEASYQALSAGVSSIDVLNHVHNATILAKGGFTELSVATDVLTSISNAYGKEVYKEVEIMDKLIQTQNLGKTTVDQLGRSLYNVIPIAASLKIGLDDILGGLAAVTAQGTPTNVATTQMRQLLAELSNETSNVGKNYEKLTGETFRDFIARGGSLNEALRALKAGATQADVPISQLFNSIEAGMIATTLTTDELEKMNETVDGIKDSTGEAQKAYDTMMSSMSEKWKVLGAEIRSGMLENADTFRLLSESAIDFIRNTLAWVEKLMVAVKFIDDIANIPKQVYKTFFKSEIKGLEEDLDEARLVAEEIKKIKTPGVEAKITGSIETDEQIKKRLKVAADAKKEEREREKRERERQKAEEEAWRLEDKTFHDNLELDNLAFNENLVELEIEFQNKMKGLREEKSLFDSELDIIEQEYKHEKEQAIYEQNALELEKQLKFYANKEEYALNHAETMLQIKENELNEVKLNARKKELEESKSFNSQKHLQNLKETLMKDSFNFMVKQNGNVLKNMGNFLVQSAANAAIQAGSEIFYDGLKLTLSGGKNIVKGIAISANPLTPGLGAPLIAAGGAEVAKGAGNIAIASALGFAGSVASSSGGSGGGSDSGFSPNGQGSEEAEKTSQQIEKDKTVTIYTDGDVKNVLLGMMTEFDKLAKDYDIINVVSR